MSTRVLLIRHALTDTGARLCGSFDVPLSDGGRAQLTALTARGSSHPGPEALYTSSLARAKQVAGELGRVWALEPRLADWAREIHCGDVEGLPLDQLQRDIPELWARNQAQDDDAFAWPGGETYQEFRARVLAGLGEIAAAHPGGRIALVTHAGVISQILGAVRGRRPAIWTEERPDPLTATELAWVNGGPSAILRYNDPDWF